MRYSVFFNSFCVISVFRRDLNEVFALLGCAATYIGIYWRFGTTCRTEMLWNVGNHKYGQRDIPEESEDLKSICQAVSSDSQSVSFLSAVLYQFAITLGFLPRHFLMGFFFWMVTRLYLFPRLPYGSVLFATVRFSRQRSYFRSPAHSPLALIWTVYRSPKTKDKQKLVSFFFIYFYLVLDCHNDMCLAREYPLVWTSLFERQKQNREGLYWEGAKWSE